MFNQLIIDISCENKDANFLRCWFVPRSIKNLKIISNNNNEKLIACCQAMPEAIKDLLKNGEAPETGQVFEEASLCQVCKNVSDAHIPLIKMLIEHKANVSYEKSSSTPKTRHPYGLTNGYFEVGPENPLRRAIEARSPEAVSLLLDNNAKIEFHKVKYQTEKEKKRSEEIHDIIGKRADPSLIEAWNWEHSGGCLVS